MSDNSLYKTISKDEFRIVHILPGSFDDDIRCVLETRPREIKTRYEALSYEWGDASAPKPIRIARREYLPPTFATQGLVVGKLAANISKSWQLVMARYGTLLRLLNWSAGTFLFWYPLSICVSRGYLEAPGWARWLLSEQVYLLFVCMICGEAPLEYVGKIFRLVAEIKKTKPWLLVFDQICNDLDRAGRSGSLQPLDFQTLAISGNLAAALRYLRLERSPRALWVDAMCINQEDQEEKVLQIQQMGRTYANASRVVIWIGAYHGLVEPDTCTTQDSSRVKGDDCEHIGQIRAAFEYARRNRSWRLFIPRRLLGRDRTTLLGDGLPGLRQISGRGWFKRLWVIQEVALATGEVQLQCGHDTCTFTEYRSAHYRVLYDHAGDSELEQDLASSKHMLDIVKIIAYSEFHDRPSDTAKLSRKLVAFLMGPLVSQKTKENLGNSFHEQSHAQRLQRLLLGTAGHFRCRNDYDRLYAILGICGGARRRSASVLSGIVGYFSSFSTQMIISQTVSPALQATSSTSIQCATGAVMSGWAIFYEEYARHWTVNRPEFVVDQHKDVLNAVSQASAGRDRAAFFTALARYIAEKNGGLALLDAANCGEDEDTPTWVPTWVRPVGQSALDSATRSKKMNEPQAAFRFSGDSKTLVFEGQSKGGIHIVRSNDAEARQSALSHVRDMLESWLALPGELKGHLVKVVVNAYDIISKGQSEVPFEVKQELFVCTLAVVLICLDVGSALIKEELGKGGGMLLYSLDTQADHDIGFLQAGEATKGDVLVFVPGCFHRLVLRGKGKSTEGVPLWRLVGLVSMSTRLKEYKACSKDEWEKLRRAGDVFRYFVQ